MAIPKNLARCTGHRVAAAVAALAIAVALPAAAQPKTDSKPTDSKPTDAHRRDDGTARSPPRTRRPRAAWSRGRRRAPATRRCARRARAWRWAGTAA